MNRIRRWLALHGVFLVLWNKKFNKAKLSAEHYNAAFEEMTHQKEKKTKKGLVNIKKHMAEQSEKS
jgi:hypothetical protein